MRIITLFLLVYLCGAAGTYAKVFEDQLGPEVSAEEARDAGLQAALAWPVYWLAELQLPQQ